MNYMGSKRRVAKDLLPQILKNVTERKTYIEPFVGGCNMMDKIPDCIQKIGADINPYLIALWRCLQRGWCPPTNVSREDYQAAKNGLKTQGLTEEEQAKIAFIGFCCSFGGKWFNGYAKDDDRIVAGDSPNTRSAGAWNTIKRQLPKIQHVQFICESYDKLEIPINSLIYCDPPYRGTTKYKATDEFNYEKFYEWCKLQKLNGNEIYISEYNIPDPDFKLIAEVNFNVYLNQNKPSEKIERLYTL